MDRIPVHGTPLARGRQYGQLASARIQRSIAAYREVFEKRAGLPWNDAVEHARMFIAPIEDFLPEALHEMRGIAEGAGVPFETILALNCRSELMFAAARERGETPPSECTSFAVAPEASAGGHMLLGQNWDWVPFARDLCVLLEVQRDDKPSFATIVEAGLLAKVGMNSARFGLCTNTLVSERDTNRAGVPYHVMLRRLLDSETVADAERILGSAERAMSANYLVADRSGGAVNFETTAGGTEGIYATRPQNGLLAHTNHFVSPAFAPIDAYLARSPHSLTRLSDMWQGLRASETLSVRQLQNVLRSHEHAPTGICGHPDPAAPPLYARCTVASFVADLTAGEFWFTDGPPCASAYEAYDFAAHAERA